MRFNLTRKKVIVAVIAVFIVLPVLSFIVYRTAIVPNQNTITTSTDPITKEQIIDGDTTPENGGDQTENNQSRPVFYGTQFVAPLYGDNSAFPSFQEQVLSETYASAKAVKISPDNVTKQVNTNQDTGITTIEVSFDFYLDEDTSNPYRAITNFNSDSGQIDSTITEPSGRVITATANTNGD